MKEIGTIIIICALSLGLALCGTAWAEGPSGMGKAGGPMFIARSLFHNMTVQVLSDLSKQPAETIRQQLKEQHLSAVLNTYNIDRKAFREAMQAKGVALINLLTQNGYLTAEQSNKIQEQMQKFSQRRQLMTLLVEKGLADGTITQEQAQILMPKRP